MPHPLFIWIWSIQAALGLIVIFGSWLTHDEFVLESKDTTTTGVIVIGAILTFVPIITGMALLTIIFGEIRWKNYKPEKVNSLKKLVHFLPLLLLLTLYYV